MLHKQNNSQLADSMTNALDYDKLAGVTLSEFHMVDICAFFLRMIGFGRC